MALITLRFSIKLPVEPARLYDAWLDSKTHAAFTGAPASIDPRVGGAFTAWGDYIRGTTLELDEGRRIVQSWRASEFRADDADSRVCLVFEPDGKKGTLLTLEHSGVPKPLAGSYEAGWVQYYFKPMRRYFQLQRDRTEAKAKATARKATVQKASKKAAVSKSPTGNGSPKKRTAVR